jgi:phospholipid/cholesterol/gamma-HCH transport system substrate-binding protein
MQSEPKLGSSSQPPNIEFKVALLIIVMVILMLGSLVYVMYARGVFESTQRVVLIADDSEGVIVGMDLTFSGFPIGRVQRVELSDEGKARIIIEVAREDAKWLRTSSVFTMERSMVGSTHLHVYSGILADPPLPDGAVRAVLIGDAAAEIPQLVNTVRGLVENLQNMTKPDSSLNMSLGNLQTVTQNLTGPYGALSVVLGSEAHAKKVISTLDESKTAMIQVNTILGEVRTSLKGVDAVLVEAQAVGANVRVATTDLAALREQVEMNLRKVDHLVDEINRKWPLARDTELKLP